MIDDKVHATAAAPVPVERPFATADDPAMPRLPSDVREITADWLTNALRSNFPGVVVTRADIEDVIHGTATEIRVRAQFNEAGLAAGLPATFIVKGGFSAHREVMSSICELEMRFYRDLRRCGAPAPSFADGWDAYRAQIVSGLYYWLVNVVEFQAELNNCAVAPRFALVALDHAAFA